MVRKCPRCGIRPKKKHLNAKWCGPCARELRKRPLGKLTPAQERKVRKLAGTMYIKALARKVGTSDSNLDRWAKQNGVNINALKYRSELVLAVCDYYARHGRPKTEEAFPHISVRSIVERYDHGPRLIRWTNKQIIELARMGGLVSFRSQSRYFNRPRAHEGSIKSVWMKKFGQGGGSVNGLSHWIGRRFVKPGCPVVRTRYWSTRRGFKPEYSRRLYLWTDIEKHLKPDAPEELKLAAPVLARFQRWLHGTKNVRPRVNRLIKELEP